MKFPTDYDKKNPLTAKQGFERLLNMQIDEAKKSGNEEQVKALQQQMAMNASLTPQAAMNGYMQQNMARQAV